MNVTLPDGKVAQAPPWLSEEFRAAVRRNLTLLREGRPELLELARAAKSRRASKAARLTARELRAQIRYVFNGRDHRIADLDRVLARGYGACGDAAAAAMAVFYAGGLHRPVLCYETLLEPSYAHARVYVGGVAVEPWPEVKRPEARRCTLLVDVSDVLAAD